MAAGGAECCGFCVRVHVGVEVRVHRCACACASLAACSTRSLTQQHCQLFPLNTTPPCPPPRHLGKQSHPLMRSHMLMSRDVSGIPSFLPPPPPPPLRRFPLGAHTLRSLVKT